jgi:hypothetical protein
MVDPAVSEGSFRGLAAQGAPQLRAVNTPASGTGGFAEGASQTAMFEATGEPQLEIRPQADQITSFLPRDMDVLGGAVLNHQGTAILGRVFDADVVCCDGALFVAPGAKVIAPAGSGKVVHGKRVVIAGDVEADMVRADELLVVVPGGRLTAREVVYGRLSIRGGASVNATGAFREARPDDPSADDDYRRILGPRSGS